MISGRLLAIDCHLLEKQEIVMTTMLAGMSHVAVAAVGNECGQF
jgi:hypothetical protein